MADNLDSIRAQWAKEKASGLWDESHLERERQVRPKWIEEQLRLRAENARKAFLDKPQS
jgi:hypothetical protein